MGLAIRLANESEFDCISLGEIMLRFDPGEGRIRNARSLRVWEGGGEYNVARGLKRCFNQRTAVVTRMVKLLRRALSAVRERVCDVQQDAGFCSRIRLPPNVDEAGMILHTHSDLVTRE